MAGSVIKVEYRGRVAVVTIDNVAKLNALNRVQYYELASRLREVATHDEVFITLLIGRGRYFSAGADVTSVGDAAQPPAAEDLPAHLSEQERRHLDLLRNFVANNLNITQAFASHPKILVVGLNGPVVGLTAALVAFADFIYAAPHAFLLTPFSSLGLVAEGGSSRALVQRLGLSKAKEALIMSRRIGVEELRSTGFVNEVLEDCGPGEDDRFRDRVLREIDSRLGDHLNGGSLLGIKALVQRPDRDLVDLQNVNEVFAGLGRFMTGEPQEEFRRLASKEKRHKL